MSVFLSPIGNGQQFFTDAGTPLNQGLIETYQAGTLIAAATYTTNLGNVQNDNPIELGVDGRPPNEIWLPGGTSYLFILKDSLGNTLDSWDNLSGINDTTSTTIDQWIPSNLTPTYVSATSFALTGNQTTNFSDGRALKTVNTGGTTYSLITSSSYNGGTGLTTIVVSNVSGTLDAGLSSVAYGIITSVNTSLPAIAARSGANSDITSLTGLTTPLSIAQGGTGQAYGEYLPFTAAVNANALTGTLAAGAALNFTVAGVSTPITTSGALTLTIPDGATVGSTSAVKAKYWWIALYNSGTPEIAVINCYNSTTKSLTCLNENEVITTVAIGTGSDSSQVYYSTTLRSSQPFVILGYTEQTEATAGTYATAPSKTQGYGIGVPKPGTLLQSAYAFDGAYAAGTTALPVDNTIPQNTEGNQFISKAIVASSETNLFDINHIGNYGSGNFAAATITVALFQDSTAGALCSAMGITVSGPGQAVPLSYRMQAGTVSSTEFKIRAGRVDTQGLYFNGRDAAGLDGGVMLSMLEIKEMAR